MWEIEEVIVYGSMDYSYMQLETGPEVTAVCREGIGWRPAMLIHPVRRAISSNKSGIMGGVWRDRKRLLRIEEGVLSGPPAQ